MSGVEQGAATQIWSRKAEARLETLPCQIHQRVEDKVDDVGRRLRTFPHFRMEDADTYRLRVGDYRVIYEFDTNKNELYLIALGHRRDIYK